MVSAGTVITGRYRLERMLGEGGMGQVWVARHLNLDSLVALKLLAPSAVSNEVLRARFEREARALGQLRSPHVVQIFDYGLDESNVPFMVMELLEGEDLAILRSQRRYWTLSEVAQIVVQASRGLAAAHKAGVIHRDVKPGNLFLAQVEGMTILKVLDFGIAKSLEEGSTELTKTNVGVGSPSYMSPEQTLTQPVDGRTDVWSLAVVAFVLLTGELPFQAESPFLVGQKVLRGQRPKPTEIVEGLPRALDAFFDRAMAVSPDERFATPMEMAEALTGIARLYPNASAFDPDAVQTEKLTAVHVARAAALNAGRDQAQLGRTVKLSPGDLLPGLARAGLGLAIPAPPSSSNGVGHPTTAMPRQEARRSNEPPSDDGVENAPTAKLNASSIREAISAHVPRAPEPRYNPALGRSYNDAVGSAPMRDPFASKRRALMIAAIVGGTAVNVALIGGLFWMSGPKSPDPEPTPSSRAASAAATQSAPQQTKMTPWTAAPPAVTSPSAGHSGGASHPWKP